MTHGALSATSDRGAKEAANIELGVELIEAILAR